MNHSILPQPLQPRHGGPMEKTSTRRGGGGGGPDAAMRRELRWNYENDADEARWCMPRTSDAAGLCHCAADVTL